MTQHPASEPVPVEQVDRLPATMPGHWDTPAGREMAITTLNDPHMARSRERISDFALANEVFLSPGIANLTAAKERIRWLSARLAASTPITSDAGPTHEERVEYEERILAAEMVVERLRDALSPFARATFEWERAYPDEFDDDHPLRDDSELTVGDLRCARRALASLQAGEAAPVVEGWTRRSLAAAIADGYSDGNEQYDEADAHQQQRYLMAADAILSATPAKPDQTAQGEGA